MEEDLKILEFAAERSPNLEKQEVRDADRGLFTAFTRAVEDGRIEQSRTGNYFLTDKGFNRLMQHRVNENTKGLDESIQTLDETISDFSESSEEINQEMLEHTKRLKIYTIILLAVTVLLLFIEVYGVAL